MHRLFSAAPTGATGASLRSRAAATAVALLLALQPLGPGVAQTTQAPRLPDLGDESEAGVTPAQERKLGESVVAQIRASGGYLDDPEVNDYLNELGNRLVSAGADRFDFEFFAVPDPSINAFALPGGFVGVNTGLVLLAQSESELASVLAHEITHVTQRHYTRSLAGQQRSLLYSLAALAVAIAASRSGSSSAGQATSAAVASAQALAIQTQLNYTREHEYEADRIGYQRLVAAGFDPTSMATFMDRLQKSNRFADGNAPSYLRSHPITYERVAEAQARAYGEPYRQVARLARLPPRARAAAQLHGHRPRGRRVFPRRAGRAQVQQSESPTRYGLVAALLRAKDVAAREAGARDARRRGADAPDDRRDGRARADGVRRSSRGDRAVRAGAREVPEQDAARLRLPRRAGEGRPRRRRGARSSRPQLARFPGNGPLHRDRRAGLRHAWAG